jgi:aldehyde dehydrogenase (NAD+)
MTITALERRRVHEETAARVITPAACLIGKDWISDTDAGPMSHINPTTGRPQGRIAVATAREVDEAVRVARRAQPPWQDTPVNQRRTVLLNIAKELRSQADDFALIGALEMGVPTVQARGAPILAADYFEYYAGWADKLVGQVVPVYPTAAFDYTLPEPYGVIAAVINWNGPLTALGRKVAPALAAGNTIVAKSPELAPFALQKAAELFLTCGLPQGVFNVVTGDASTGALLVGHPGIDKISFTGSGGTARAVMATATQNLTPLTLELGGKSANIVFADGDLAAAAETAVFGTVKNAGQGCLLPSRLLAQSGIYEEMCDLVLKRLATVSVGDPLAQVDMGPVISAGARDRILKTIDDASRSKYGTLLTGGKRLADDLADGYFIEPTVFGDVDPGTSLAQREVFGPVLSIMRFDDEPGAIELANSTPFALAAYVHTNDLGRAHRLASRLRAGYLSVNGVNPMPPTAPFGGMGESGFGREGGAAGIDEFVQIKNVWIGLPGKS